jgi:hypothetical protein
MPGYAIAANPVMLSVRSIFFKKTDREPEIEMVPFGLMFNRDPYEMLIPACVPEFDDLSLTNQKK